MPDEKRAAIGMRAHSGWAVLVAVTGEPAAAGVLDRRRIETADRSMRGTVQPYHACMDLPLKEAERFISHCTASSRALACDGLERAVAQLKTRGYRPAVCALLTGSGKPLPDLAKILASHPLLHTAEGELFRGVLRHAAEACGLPCVEIREKSLREEAAVRLGIPSETVDRHLAEMSKPLGAPWRQDEKLAALAGWIAQWGGHSARAMR